MKSLFQFLFLSLILNCNAQCWSDMSAGGSHSIALRTDGSLWAWGSNYYGQLGIGSNISQYTAVRVGTDNDWSFINTGESDSFGIKTDGSLWGWGRNQYGQLGDGSVALRHSPVRIGNDNDWISISNHGYHTLALKADHTLWGWGNETSYYGFINSITPVQIGTDTWKTVCVGQHYIICIKSDGTLWGWGRNENGVLGDGTTTARTQPIQIGTDNQWESVSAATTHTMAIKNDGSLWAWGTNFFGCIGDGTVDHKLTPTRIGTDNDWKSAFAGYHTSKAIKDNGTFWSWGHNTLGELGDGTTLDRIVPAQIGSANNWAKFSHGLSYWQLGLRDDNSLWGWGYNSSGEATGNGTNTFHLEPILLNCVGLNTITSSTESFSIYPNPVKSKLYINTAARVLTVTVYEISGRKLSYTKSDENCIDLSNLATGSYIIEVETKNGSFSSKILKE